MLAPRSSWRSARVTRLLAALAAFTVAAAVLAACGDDDDTSTDTTAAPGDTTADTSDGLGGELEGTRWVLTSAGDITLPEGTAITATFADGTVNGSAGCNTYNAAYTVDGSSLTIEQAAATQMACLGPIMAAETAYLAALAQTESYTIADDGTLELALAGGLTLGFSAEEQSVEGSWTAIGYLKADGSAFTSVINGTELTAEFAADGTVSGSSGCNTYNGGYEVDAESITVSPLASTRMACAEPEGVDAQEADFLAAMQSATTFAVEAGTLTLFDGEGRRAVELTSAG